MVIVIVVEVVGVGIYKSSTKIEGNCNHRCANRLRQGFLRMFKIASEIQLQVW